LTDGLKVGAVVAEGAVFIFDLDKEDRTAIADLQRGQFLS
jgi:hypothetical protein